MENKYRIYVYLAENGQILAVSGDLTEDGIKEAETVLDKLLTSGGAGYFRMPEVGGDVYIPLDVLRECVIRISST